MMERVTYICLTYSLVFFLRNNEELDLEVFIYLLEGWNQKIENILLIGIVQYRNIIVT